MKKCSEKVCEQLTKMFQFLFGNYEKSFKILVDTYWFDEFEHSISLSKTLIGLSYAILVEMSTP